MEELLRINPELRSEPICAYRKVFPRKEQIIKYKTPYVLADGTADSRPKNASAGVKTSQQKIDEQTSKSLSAAITRICDIVACNFFDMFVTLTANCTQCRQNCKNDPSLTGKKSGCVCDRATCKRYDVDYQRRNVFAWINHQKKIHPHFIHIIVMELHEDGAPHFHALFGGYTGRLIEHEISQRSGKMQYNLAEYKRGITKVEYITQSVEDYGRVSSYLTKYIIKDMPLFPGRNRYACSKGLRRPVIIPNPADTEKFEKHPDAKVWTPPVIPYISKRSHQMEYPVVTNVESITTIECDNEAVYLHELSHVQSKESPRLSPVARMALRARSHLNRLSSRTRRSRIADDSRRVAVSGAGA